MSNMSKLTRITLAALAVLVAVALQSVPASASTRQEVAQTFRCPVPQSTFVDSWHAPRVGHLHIGTDMMAPDGTPILAPEGGTYRQHGSESFYLDGDSGIQWFGTHLSAHVASDGRVEAGQAIALVGHSGNASPGSPHLHIEVHPGGGEAVNPYPYMQAACSTDWVAVGEALRFVAQVPPPTYPYGALEVLRWYNATHNPNIKLPVARQMAAYFNASVDQQLGQYLLAVYLSRVQTTSCSSPSSCAAMVTSVFSRIAPAFASGAPRVMYCESGGNPYASNGGRYLGLFQHAAGAWASRAASYGVPGRPWYDGYANAVVAAHMVANDGGWRQWSCRP